jgi:hypothetical protein
MLAEIFGFDHSTWPPVTGFSNMLPQNAGSAFVAVGALLGVEVRRVDNEHAVALDADTVQRALSRRALGLAGLVLTG